MADVPKLMPRNPGELHPAAAEAAVVYSQALQAAESYKKRCESLEIECASQQKHLALLERQLAVSERERSRLDRYVAEQRTRLRAIVQLITEADTAARAFADAPPPEPQADGGEIEKAIADAVINRETTHAP